MEELKNPVGVLHIEDREEFEAWERAKKLQEFKDANNGKTPWEVIKASREYEGRTPASYDTDIANRDNIFK